MFHRCLAALGCCVALGFAAAENGKPVAFFSTGDCLPGVISSVENNTAIRFDSPVLVDPATIDLAKLLELRSSAVVPEVKSDHLAIVKLTNGCVLRGQLGALDDETVALDTWYAGRIVLQRWGVESLKVIDRTRSIYSGPRGAEGWTFTGDGESAPWRFEGGSMVSESRGGAARKLKLPDRVAVSFDIAWRASLRFHLVLFSDDLKDDYPNNCYSLGFNQHYVQLTKYTNSNPQSIGNAGVTKFREREKLHVDFFADRKNSVFVLEIDGDRVATWRDPNPGKTKMGDGVHFVSESTNEIRISQIDIRAWDGRVENEDGAASEAGPDSMLSPDMQRIRLRNGDMVVGKVLGVENERLTIETPHGTIHLPVGRVSGIVLHSEEELKTECEACHKPKLMKGDVKAWFPEGGNVVFRLDGIEGDHYVGFSQIFGTVRFRRDAFNRVEFNVHKAELEPLRPKHE